MKSASSWTDGPCPLARASWGCARAPWTRRARTRPWSTQTWYNPPLRYNGYTHRLPGGRRRPMRPSVYRYRLLLRLWLMRTLGRLWLAPRVFYVGSSEVLPPPLTPAEEAELIGRLQRGDTSVRGQLIERNLRLVVYIARKFENTGVAIEDLVSIGTIGLIKAVNTFDPGKNIKLATYASRCIENEILMYLRRNSKTRAEVSFDEPLNTDWDGNELLLSDVIGTESDVTRRLE